MLTEVSLANYFDSFNFQHEFINDLHQYDGLKACLDKIIQQGELFVITRNEDNFIDKNGLYCLDQVKL